MLSSSESDQSDRELVPAVMPEVRVKGRKYSSQMKEYVEYDGKVSHLPPSSLIIFLDDHGKYMFHIAL